MFTAWIDTVSQVSTLLNSAAIVKWNMNKTYLQDLQQAGVPIVPTEYLTARTLLKAPGDCEATNLQPDTDTVTRLLQAQQGRVVVKPSVGCDGVNIEIFDSFNPHALAHARTLLRRGQDCVLLQPFLPSITSMGELSLIYIQGKFSHAVRKYPGKGDFRVQERFVVDICLLASNCCFICGLQSVLF